MQLLRCSIAGLCMVIRLSAETSQDPLGNSETADHQELQKTPAGLGEVTKEPCPEGSECLKRGNLNTKLGVSVLQRHHKRDNKLPTEDVEEEPGINEGNLLLALDTTKTVAHRLVYHEDSLASGCSSIYLDVGSNVGVQIRKLFEPLKYPGAQILPLFDKLFGPIEARTKSSHETGLCAFGFEANPKRLSRLQEIEKTYNAHGWRVKFIAPFIVDIVDGQQIPFHIAGYGEGKEYDLGSSIANRRHTHNTVDVSTFDFPAFLQKEIFSVNPKKVVMKMDIEGSEFVVLPELARRNYLCRERVNEMFIEWHDEKAGLQDKFRKHIWPTKEDVQEDVEKQACQLGVTELADVDDESFWDDGKPLP